MIAGTSDMLADGQAGQGGAEAQAIPMPDGGSMPMRQALRRCQTVRTDDVESHDQERLGTTETPITVPVGACVVWPFDLGVRAVPEGWQLADGSLITDTRSPLYGGCTFDLRAHHPVGRKAGDADFGFDVDGTSRGDVEHDHADHDFDVDHAHTYSGGFEIGTDGKHNHGDTFSLGPGFTYGAQNGTDWSPPDSVDVAFTADGAHTHTVSPTGVPNAFGIDEYKESINLTHSTEKNIGPYKVVHWIQRIF